MANKANFTSGAAPMHDTPYTNSYQSIGGTDIKAVFSGVTFGNLQAISYSISREKAPIYTMGSPEPRGFSRGKRGIAGSLVFIMFDSHALLETFRALSISSNKYKFVSDNDETRPLVATENRANILAGQTSNARPGLLTTGQRTSNFEAGLSNGQLDSGWSKQTPWYSDQIPPFNVVLTGVNEYGYASTMAVLGVEILNEGYGISIDDIVSEQQMTYVARGISPWTRITGAKFQKNSEKWNIPSTTGVVR